MLGALIIVLLWDTNANPAFTPQNRDLAPHALRTCSRRDLRVPLHRGEVAQKASSGTILIVYIRAERIKRLRR